jgi:thiopurine S-methyltransferase
MTPEFWKQRWQRGEIGWHSDEINRHLAEHWPDLGVPADSTVLVPLCGKSLDLLWLAGRGHRVLGVELSGLAVEAFFAENGLIPVVDDMGPFRRYSAEEIVLLAGDFFALEPAQVASVGAVYDRASLIALPPGMRPAYAARLTALLPAGVRSLLITLDYDQSAMDGPPFSVGPGEVAALFGDHFDIDPIGEHDVLGDSPKFAARGVDRLGEHVYRLQRR